LKPAGFERDLETAAFMKAGVIEHLPPNIRALKMPFARNKRTLLLSVITLSVVAAGYALRWYFARISVNLLGFWAAIYIDVILGCLWIALIVLARLKCGLRGYWLFAAAPWVLQGPFIDWYIFTCSAHKDCL
jgi:hypothetical protein